MPKCCRVFFLNTAYFSPSFMNLSVILMKMWQIIIFFVKFVVIFTISLRKTSKPVYFVNFLPVSAVFDQKMMNQTVLILGSFRRF